MKQNYAALFAQLKQHGLDPMGAVTASQAELYRMPYQTQQEIKGWLIAENFRFHYENNAYYRELSESYHVGIDDIKSYEDIIKLPLIPVKRFKQSNSHQLLSKGLGDIELESRSTGTSGIPSVTRRCKRTMDRVFQAVAGVYREFFRFSKGGILFLMPSADEMPEMGMVKALTVLSGMVDTAPCIFKEMNFSSEEAIDILESWANKHERHIVGPPFLINRFLQYLEKNDIRLHLDRQTRIITLGGWKRFTGMECNRKVFNQRCAEYLGIKEDQVRDMYGLVEGNMLAVECSKQAKHVPPWVHFSVRDLDNLAKEVPLGERGLLAIIDPLTETYPSFILTEDVVYLDKTIECACGRVGQKVNYLSRISGAELGCCAINLERQMSEKGTLEEDACLMNN